MADLRIAQVSGAASSQSDRGSLGFESALAQLAHADVGDVRLDRHDRMLYSTDASIYQVEPLAVVVPRNVNQLTRAVGVCAAHRLPVICRGGGTSLAGQAVGRAVIIDTSRWLTNIGPIDAVKKRVHVEPGVVLDALNLAASAHGLMFGPDVATSSHASIGGMIGNNSAGARSILYGHTAEHVLSIDAVLADGRPVRFSEGAAGHDATVRELTQRVADIVQPIAPLIRTRFPKTRRHVSGYNLHLLLQQFETSAAGTFDRVNLSQLICGSEGTLAIVTGADVGLVDRPVSTSLAIVALNSLDDAIAAVSPLLETNPSAVELLDDMVLDLAQGNIECAAGLELIERVTGVRRPRAVLYVEYASKNGANTRAKLEESLRGHLPACGAVGWLVDPGEITCAWKLRKSGEPLLHSVPGSRKPITFIEDTAVDPQRLLMYVREMRQLIESFGTRAAFYAHASVGCLHIRPMLDLHVAGDIDRMERIAQAVADLVRSHGGALSGEHGDGRVRSPLLERTFGKDITDAFRKIKDIFDPEHRLNPGNIVEPEPMTSHLRTRPGDTFVSVPPVRTYFRFEREHGFASAVEMCNGAGLCRKRAGGTMCPSYRATLDERHATRGRANALRLAMTGQFGHDAAPEFDDAETLETLKLCLSCKACKRECPSNVDVARLKSEYLAHSYARRGGAPLAVRAIGNVRQALKAASIVPGVSRAAAGSALVRSLMERTLQIDRRRSLPSPAPSLFRWMRRRSQSTALDRPTVLMLADCFTTYSETSIGMTAVRVLEHLGYHVAVPDVGCCGRSLISVGMLAEAQRTCARTAKALHQALTDSGAIAIVGLEPSCVSAICDDWLDLNLPGADRQASELAERTMLLETFIEKHASKHGLPIVEQRFEKRVLLHPHCHQNALWGAESSAGALRRVVSESLRVLESGCCGMAGSFGFMLDQYDLSMQIGELSLFPAVRAEPEAVICAPGTSCRHQLRDALGVHALHPIELIAERVGVAVP